MNWVLIIYLSTGIGNHSTGGPAAVPGFETQEACKKTGERWKVSVPKFDWYACVPADMPLPSAHTIKVSPTNFEAKQ